MGSLFEEWAANGGDVERTLTTYCAVCQRRVHNCPHFSLGSLDAWLAQWVAQRSNDGTNISI